MPALPSFQAHLRSLFINLGLILWAGLLLHWTFEGKFEYEFFGYDVDDVLNRAGLNLQHLSIYRKGAVAVVVVLTLRFNMNTPAT